MKKILIVAFLMLFGASIHANYNSFNPFNKFEPNDKVSLKLNLGKINDLPDGKIYSIIENFVTESLSAFPYELECEISITGTVDLGPISFEIRITVSGPCGEVRAKGGQIAEELMKQIQTEIRKRF